MKILGKIGYGLFLTLLLGVVSLFVATLLPIPGNIEIKIVKSGSMEPSIPTGSIVVVKPAASYAVGDIITFGEDTGRQIPTTHRVVSVLEENGRTAYMTKGDANEEADPVRIAGNEVIGKVVFSVPFAGFIIDFARQPIGFTLMIGIPAGLIILDETFRILREILRMKRRKERARLREAQARGHGQQQAYE
jgi:signal peptidase